MNRKNFIKKTIIAATAVTSGNGLLNAKYIKVKKSNYDSMMNETSLMNNQVGFNHLPIKEIKTMKSVLHRANTRGRAEHGWLNSHHSFSFAKYYNPERMNFGVLRVLNDDIVSEKKGFGTHPHDNMEIVSIPLSGNLEHKDSMGNVAVIKQGDVQVMSAGTGVYHSEYNESQNEPVQFLQIWMFPNKKNVTPRYDQITLDSAKMKDNLYQILSPNANDDGVWAHQDAWWYIGHLNEGFETTYNIKNSSNGVYVFVLEGDVMINDQLLAKRDGYGLWDTKSFHLKTKSEAKVLVMDVPMDLN